jgi:hypothetical protein
VKPSDYIDAIYHKDSTIKYVEDAWAPLYLNKIFIQNSNNASAMEKTIEYCLYISPTHYFYLLYILIPQQFGVRYKYPKKDEEKEPDELESKLKEILGWSSKEFELNRKQIEKTILNNRSYWESEMGIDGKRKRK